MRPYFCAQLAGSIRANSSPEALALQTAGAILDKFTKIVEFTTYTIDDVERGPRYLGGDGPTVWAKLLPQEARARISC